MTCETFFMFLVGGIIGIGVHYVWIHITKSSSESSKAFKRKVKK